MSPLKNMSLVAVFTALVWVGAIVKFPIGPVPITLQTLCALLLGLRLPPKLALQAMLLYLVLGVLGLPVFSGGNGGWASFVSPRGGYLWGMALQAVVLSLVCERSRRLLHGKRRRLLLAGFVFLSSWFPYLLGLPWLAFRLHFGVRETLLAGMIPFIPGDVLKGVVAWLLAPLLLEQRWRQSPVEEAKQSSCR